VFKRKVGWREQPELMCCLNCKHYFFECEGEGYCAYTASGRFPVSLEPLIDRTKPYTPALLGRIVSDTNICDFFEREQNEL
jgi:hypothetical protein